jgi:Skp family chaperone for outer membrane proteins
LQSVLQKRGELDSEQEFLKQKRNLEDKEWMEKLYQATLKIVNDLAKEKGLDLVLEKTEPQFPISGDELLATFSTHKVLYSGSCPDLTREVIARLDALESLKP